MTRGVWRPQWAYPEVPGTRDEVFIVGPFPLTIPQTGMLTLDLPVQMDDDVNFYIRGIVLDRLIGTTFGQGMLIRIRDCYGNPLCTASNPQLNGLVLGMGSWGNQAPEVNAFGFPVEPEVECSPGGTVLIDIQAPSNGNGAQFAFTVAPETITFVAAIGGAAGNTLGYSITLVDPGAPNVPLSVAVVGNAVTVTLQTDGASAIISTFADVQAISNSTPAVQAVMYALLSGSNPLTVITALATSALAGGVNGTPVTIYGIFIGVKRFQEC